jgi:hypothetical protein
MRKDTWTKALKQVVVGPFVDKELTGSFDRL